MEEEAGGVMTVGGGQQGMMNEDGAGRQGHSGGGGGEGEVEVGNKKTKKKGHGS